jgi:digeranylgeranylglycerophospholipid reductase
MDYDIVIIGAGPAGLCAAIEIADKASVLIIDRKQEIGCPKRCAEGLSLRWFKKMNLEPSQDWAVQEIKGAQLYAPNGKSIKMKSEKVEGYVLERKIFEKYLAIKAVEKGAKILMKNQLIQAERKKEDEIELTIEENNNIKKISCKLVIACDGVESLTAKMLGLNTKLDLNETDSGYQYEMTGITNYDENVLHLFFGTDVAPRGYIWIFPKRNNTANIGIGIGAYEKETAKYYLDKWIQKQEGLKNGSIIEVNAGIIPVGGFLEKMQENNLLVAGDAGHMVDPVHGGGIGIAMEGGRLAGKHAKRAIKENDFTEKNLSTYTKEWYELSGNDLKRRLKGRHLLEKLSNDDFNYLVDSITIEEALRIGNGTLTQTDKAILFTKKLITRPGLLKLMIEYAKS